MPKIVTVEEMRGIERAADAAGLTYDQMMANAGKAVADAVLEWVGDLGGKKVLVLAGTGNNGGDGLVAGDLLAEAGAQVSVYLIKSRAEDDPHVAKLRERELLIAEAGQDQRWRVLRLQVGAADVILDAVLGTGFRLPLKGAAKDVLKVVKQILDMRRERPFVVAVDCPSGLDCDSGEIAEETIPADLTVTLAAGKVGLFRFPGAAAVGELVVADIGIPADQPEVTSVELELATSKSVGLSLPPRPRNAHKGTFGRTLIIAGSVNFPGAAGLSALGAYRVGAGLVTLAVPAPIQGFLVPVLPEATWLVLPHEMGVIAEGAEEVLWDEISGSSSVLIGPGFGRELVTARFLSRLIGAHEGGGRGRFGFSSAEPASEDRHFTLPPTVIDADALKLLSEISDWQRHLPAETVLTPHPGEMSVMTGEGKTEIQHDRIGVAQKWSGKWGHVVVLKGAFTVVAAPDGRTTVHPFATPALARAGTGDVLSGAIAGFMAQGLAAYEAAVIGTYVHGLAGLKAAELIGDVASVLAGDVADAIPAAMAEIRGDSSGR